MIFGILYKLAILHFCILKIIFLSSLVAQWLRICHCHCCGWGHRCHLDSVSGLATSACHMCSQNIYIYFFPLYFFMRVATFISGYLLFLFLLFLFYFLPHRQYLGIPGTGIEPTPHSSHQSHSGEKCGSLNPLEHQRTPFPLYFSSHFKETYAYNLGLTIYISKYYQPN